MNLLNTNECSATLDAIITSANKYLVIMSPYIKLSERVESLLDLADQRGVSIFIIARERLSREDYYKVKDFAKLTICIHPPLHAKVYSNEEEVLISSLNLYEFSQQKNTEMGVQFERRDEKDQFSYLGIQVLDILNDKRSELPVKRLNDSEWKKFNKDVQGKGWLF